MGIFANIILYMIGTNKQIISGMIFVIMSISIILEYHHAVHAQVYMGTNHIPFLLPSLISGFLIIVIGYMAIGKYGLLGLVLTQFFVQLSINNWYPVYLDLKLLNWKFKDYIIALISVPKLYFSKKG